MLNDGDNPSIPEYMVACKVVKEASGSLDSAGAVAAEEDLLKEALLMAQVETHPHLVSLVGVITRGNPKVKRRVGRRRVDCVLAVCCPCTGHALRLCWVYMLAAF